MDEDEGDEGKKEGIWEYGGKMGRMEENGRKWRSTEAGRVRIKGDGVNSVGIPPVRMPLPPSPAEPAVFGITVLQIFDFTYKKKGILFLPNSSCLCGSVSRWL